MKKYNLAVVPGDGIGPEVTAEAMRVADAAAGRFSFQLEWKSFPFGAEYYLEHDEALPKTALDELAGFKALLLGAIGDPRVRPGPLEQGILLALRFHFDQYINLRPAVGFSGVPLPVKPPKGAKVDAVVVRENTEDLYMGMGGDGHGVFETHLAAVRGLYSLSGTVNLAVANDIEAAFSLGLMTRPGIERVTRYAFNLAKARGETRVHVVSKANAVPHLYGFWDDVTREVAAKEFPDLEYAPMNVDAVCYRMARNPSGWGVVLCPNLFGDIVSDLMSSLAGGLGLSASGNIGERLSMFEPVHGSAPDIAKTGKANPVAAILSAAMLLRHIGEPGAADTVERAVTEYLAGAAKKHKPIELGGKATTKQVGAMVAERI